MSCTKSGCLGVLLVLMAAGWSSAEDKPKSTKPGVRVEVRFSVKEFDPKKPDEGSLEVVVRNDTDKAIDVPTGYAQSFDTDVVLFGRVGKDKKKTDNVYHWWDLRLVKRERDSKKTSKVSTAVVKPGKEMVVFKESLNALLLDRKKFGWTWQA
jgi:hypothetical protein